MKTGVRDQGLGIREECHSREGGNPDLNFLLICLIAILFFSLGIFCGGKIIENKFHQVISEVIQDGKPSINEGATEKGGKR